MQADEYLLRQALIEQCLSMNASGLNQGTAGNLSVRYENQMLITPSAIPYESLTPHMLASLPLDGNGTWTGPYKPSTEWRFHFDIYRARPQVGAVVHTHSPYATSIAITRRSIPAIHYMIALFGGNDIRCADYATFGTQALSDHALQALTDRHACLLANHGTITTAPTLTKAMWLAHELETLARQYYHALQLGNPVILSDADIAAAMQSFQGYGLQENTIILSDADIAAAMQSFQGYNVQE